MFETIAARIAASALVHSPFGAFLKSVPRWAWIALAIVALLVAGIIWHQHKAHAHDAALVKATIEKRDGLWRAALAKAHAGAIAARNKGEAAQAKISTQTKGIHDAQVRTNASLARDLQLRGPGKAAAANCGPGYYPGVSAAAGRHVVGSAGADAAAAEVHPGNGLAGMPVALGGTVRPTGSTQPSAPDSALAAVPWSWLTIMGQEHDDLLAEAIAWRTWHPKEAAEFERMRATMKGNAQP